MEALRIAHVRCFTVHASMKCISVQQKSENGSNELLTLTLTALKPFM